MSDIQFYLLEADQDKQAALALAQKTATNLETKQTTILQVIESLGEYLNNEDTAVRSKTVAYLADVLIALPTKVLSRQQRDLLNDFILSRISNGADGLGQCARALQALERLGQFDQERLTIIIKTLLDNTSPLTQVKQQSERFEALRLLDIMFSKYRKHLRALHDEDHFFLPRLIAYFDGEKDPRNLMIVFSVLNVPMVEWDISKDAQDLFDAVFNYFPITFRPPPNDPYGITAQDLKDRLRDCISSTGNFAPHAFPSLLDKLDSTSANVKRDSLITLKSCVERYGPATVNLYSITLWDAVKFEILNVQEEDLAEEALDVLQAISHQLASSPHEGPLQHYLKPIGRECNQHLEDAPTKQSSASGRILRAVANGSVESSSILIKAVVPHIVELHSAADNIPRRRGLLEVMENLVDSNATMFGKWRDVNSPSDKNPSSNLRVATNTLGDSSDECLDLLVSAVESTTVEEVSYRILALECIKGLALIRGLLSDEDLARICRMLDNIIVDETPYGKDEAKAMAIDTLVAVAQQKPQIVTETSLPAFMAQLPDADTDDGKLYVPVLEALAKLSAEQQIFGTVIVRLKNKLYSALRQKASRKYVTSILSAILFAFGAESIDVGNPAIFGKFYQEVVIPLLQDIITNGSSKFPGSPAIDHEATFDLIGRICNLIVRGQPWQAQTELCRNVYTIFRSLEQSQLPPYAASARQESLSMLTSTHLVAALQQQASPDAEIAGLIAALVNYCKTPALPPAILSAGLIQISLVVNKYVPASRSAVVTGPFLFDQPTSPLSAVEEGTIIDLRIGFAVLKALVLRADPILNDLTPKLLSLLSSRKHGDTVARLLPSLVAPDPILAKYNHCRVYAIHKQRFFGLVAPQLVKLYRERATAQDEDAKRNHLKALAGMVQHIPYELLQTELESITPLIMQSLALEEAEVKAAAILTLSKIALENADILEQHVGSLVTRLLGVATPNSETAPGGKTKGGGGAEQSQGAPSQTRAAALTCLGHLVGSLRDETLVPYQRQVVKRLSAALDDGRRTVRAEAVRCRAAWSGLAGAGEDDDDDD